jgi:L-ascorbate metabolism protein UlaG (beta-lactamase superfamily)
MVEVKQVLADGRAWRPGWRAILRSMAGGSGHSGPVSDHFDGRRFHNPDDAGGRSFWDLLRWRWTAQTRRWPSWVENHARPALQEKLAPGEVALTFINHITFLIQLPGLNLLTDPVYSERVSPFTSIGPRRVRAPGLPFEQLPPIHLVLISHNHYDHLDLATLLRLERTHRPLFVTGLGNRAFLQQFGLTNVWELDWWHSMKALDARISFTPARHWSGRGGRRTRNHTLWGGFHVSMRGAQLFFAGDTGYGRHFREIRERLGPTDIALLPIGAYEPRWFMAPQHMNPDDAVRAHMALAAQVSVGTHLGCFQLTDEGIDEPVRELAVARARHGLAPAAFQILETGETRIFQTSAAAGSVSALTASSTHRHPQ